MALISKSGSVIASVPYLEIENWLSANKLRVEDVDIELSKNESRSIIRTGIYKEAGDIPSLVGTVSDVTQLLLYEYSKLIIALSNAKDFADVRAAAQSFIVIATSFIEKVSTGETKLTCQTKGQGTVISEVEQRSTAVSNVLISSNTSEES